MKIENMKSQKSNAGLKVENTSTAGSRVKLGCERLVGRERSLIAGKQIGIVTNHSGVLPDGEHIVDALRLDPDIKIRALFSPEHGIRGTAPAGKHVGHEIDPETGIQIYSLYGEHNKPEEYMLEGIQALVYDIQDVGVRFYTYISTLALVMESAAENKIPFIVLDRPLMLAGDMMDGPLLDDEVRSFIGMLPIPVLYSLTPGELAGLIEKEYLGRKAADLEMKILKMEDYSRSMWYDETGLSWLRPSPNIPDMDTAVVYPGTALFEGTNISEGRGTDAPFRFIGAPFIDKMRLADSLNSIGLPGVKFEPIDFTPKVISIVSHSRYKDILCHGVEIVVTDRTVVRPVEVGVAMLSAIKRFHPSDLTFRADGAFDRLAGNRKIRTMIEGGADYREIASTWESALGGFRESRKGYFLY